MLRAVDHDVVSHDHLVAFVEEGDVVLTRVEHVPQSEDAAPHFFETSIRAREPGRAGEVHDNVRAHLPFDGFEVPAHEGPDVLEELSLPLGLEVALGLGVHPPGIGPAPSQLESAQTLRGPPLAD